MSSGPKVRLGLRIAGRSEVVETFRHRIAAARSRIRDSTTAGWRSMVVRTP